MKTLVIGVLMLSVVAGVMYYLSPNIEAPWHRVFMLSAVIGVLQKLLCILIAYRRGRITHLRKAQGSSLTYELIPAKVLETC